MRNVGSSVAAGVIVSGLCTALLVLALAPFRTDLGLANIGFLFLLLTLANV